MGRTCSTRAGPQRLGRVRNRSCVRRPSRPRTNPRGDRFPGPAPQEDTAGRPRQRCLCRALGGRHSKRRLRARMLYQGSPEPERTWQRPKQCSPEPPGFSRAAVQRPGVEVARRRPRIATRMCRPSSQAGEHRGCEPVPPTACFGPSRPPVSVFAGHLLRSGRPDRSHWDRGQGQHRGETGRGGRFGPKQVAAMPSQAHGAVCDGATTSLKPPRKAFCQPRRIIPGRSLLNAKPGSRFSANLDAESVHHGMRQSRHISCVQTLPRMLIMAAVVNLDRSARGRASSAHEPRRSPTAGHGPLARLCRPTPNGPSRSRPVTVRAVARPDGRPTAHPGWEGDPDRGAARSTGRSSRRLHPGCVSRV